jgi:hypothetical protein
MADDEVHLCAICGIPTTSFVVNAVEHRDGSGEVHSDPGQGDRRYYCKKHMPHLHSERLEDRIE